MKLLYLFFSVFIVSTLALGQTYFVSPAGDNLNPGTEAEPWKTIQRAADQVNPGDTVLVAGGEYHEQLTFSRSGTAENMIIFKNIFGQVPIINAQGFDVGSWGAFLYLDGVSYLRIEGFDVRNNSNGYTFTIGGESHHLEIVGNEIHNSASGILQQPSF